MPDRYAPQLHLTVDGQTTVRADTGETLDLRLGENVLSATVDLRQDAPDMFTVVFNLKKLGKFALLDAFKPGAEVTLAMGLTAAPTVLCVGEVAYVEPSFDPDLGFRVAISGYHKLHRLTRGQRSATWGDGLQATQSPMTAAGEVIDHSRAHQGDVSDALTVAATPATALSHAYIPQLNVSDFAFLRALGAGQERKLIGQGAGGIGLQQPDPRATPVARLSWDRPQQDDPTGGLVLGVQLRLSTVQQYAAVEVRSWDFQTKKNIVATVSTSTYAFDGEGGAHAAGKALYGKASAGRKFVVVDQPVNSKAEAEALAQALFDRFSMTFLTGEITVQGNPQLVPGKTVELVGFGQSFSGVYLVTSAVHTFQPQDGYRTVIGVSRNVHAP